MCSTFYKASGTAERQDHLSKDKVGVPFATHFIPRTYVLPCVVLSSADRNHLRLMPLSQNGAIQMQNPAEGWWLCFHYYYYSEEYLLQ